MITVRNLTKYYAEMPALRGISFDAGQREVIGFLGPNGAGKSTAMRILTGFYPATSGTAEVAGHEVHAAPVEVKKRVGYLPEQVPLYDEMTVTAFLRYVCAVKGVPRRARRGEIARVMARCGVTEMAARLIGHLSRGYRQRTGLAQALIGSPPVLVLDEPTVGLDPRQIIAIRRMIRELGRDHTVLLSTHILAEAAAVCDRVLIIHEGLLAADTRLDGSGGQGASRLETLFMNAVSGDVEAGKEGA
jgi:ABC-2 type transport system ATP-binding protein